MFSFPCLFPPETLTAVFVLFRSPVAKVLHLFLMDLIIFKEQPFSKHYGGPCFSVPSFSPCLSSFLYLHSFHRCLWECVTPVPQVFQIGGETGFMVCCPLTPHTYTYFTLWGGDAHGGWLIHSNVGRFVLYSLKKVVKPQKHWLYSQQSWPQMSLFLQKWLHFLVLPNRK